MLMVRGHHPIGKFTNSNTRPRLRDFHSFGCPIHNEPLQRAKSQSMWMLGAHLGIYLGMSLRHSRSVALMLNPRTGRVSPQRHVQFDDKFETVVGTSDATNGHWKYLAGFVFVGESQDGRQEVNRDVA